MIELERRLFLAISGLFLLVYGVYTDTIFVNESRLSLRLDTFAENVLVKGYHRTYIRLRNREKIIVTCSKSEPQQNGTLMAFVNTKLATQVKCLRFHRDFINDDNFCESKQFVAYVEADQSSFVDVWCRMLYDQYKSEAYAELFLSRLYEDSEPRIRNGLTLTPLDATVTHTVNLESISCEAVKDRSDESRFDSLAWFTADSTFPLTPEHHKRYELVNINDQYVNYTSIFPLDSSLLRNNSIYKCCTLYDGKIRSCQRFLAYIYAPPPTTTTTTTAAGLMAVWNKNLKDWPKIFEGIEDRDFESDSSGLTSNSTASGMSDTLIAIIVASVAGTVIIMMIILLGVLCYRKYRYDQIYLKKDRISDMQSTMTTSNQKLRRGQLIPRVELRRSKADLMDDSMGRSGEPIRAYDNSLNMTADDNSSWITNLGVEEIRRARALRENNPSEPISVLVSAQQTRVFASPSSRLQANQLVLDRNYERIEAANNIAAQNRNSSTTTVTMMATTPRLLDAKEQKRREKEMRRLAKLRVEAELKEAKLQAKLAKKQLKRGEPVALGVLSTLQSDDLDIDLYGIPRFQRASIEESVAKKTLSLEAMSLQNREQTNSITSSSFQLQPQPYHQQEQQQQQILETARDNKTSISNLSFVPPPFSISTQQQAPQTAEASTTTTMTTNTSSAAGHHLRPTPNSNGNMYSRAVSYPSKENNINQLPLPLRDNNNAVAAAYYAAAAAAQQQQVSPGVEKNNIQETVYVSPNDNQIEVFSQGAALTPSAIKSMNNQNKRKSSNGLGNIHDSNLLY